MTRLDRWERVTAGPLTVLSVLFIGVYAWPVLETGLDPSLRRACEIANIVIWAVFGAEYLIRFSLAGDKHWFLRSHWFDLAVLVLPFFRPLRALRLINALRVINRRAVAWTRGRLALYVGATTVLLVVIAALGVLDAERTNPDSAINDFPDALWWALVTITTVGYGDYYPTTIEGRVVALGLMMGGIGLIGFVTGSLATWIVERISGPTPPGTEPGVPASPSPAAPSPPPDELVVEIRQLRAEVRELREEIRGFRSPPGG